MAKKIKKWTMVIYCIISFFLLFPLIWNAHLRWKTSELWAHWYNKTISPPHYVFLGDSLTASLRNTGLQIDGNPVRGRNLGVSGYTLHQISGTADEAIQMKPEWIAILAGTNDVCEETYDEGKFVHQLRILIRKIHSSKIRLCVTLPILNTSSESNARLTKLIQRARQLCKEERVETIIDLNPIIASEGILTSEYTTDGTHLSKKALDIWVKELRKRISR